MWKYLEIFRAIPSVPQNTIMNVNNVMLDHDEPMLIIKSKKPN